MKVVLVSNTAAYLHNMWLPLARGLRSAGAEVILAAPRDDHTEALVREGFRFEHVPMPRNVASPLAELAAFRRIRQLYEDERPDIVHHFTAKPIVYGSVAARWAGVPTCVCTIAGMGHMFTQEGPLARARQQLVLRLYRSLLRSPNTWVIFQNPDDRELLLRHSAVLPERAVVIRSSGVDPERFAFERLPDGPPVVLCAARLIWDKGIGEFVEAARRVRERGLPAQFRLAGWLDDQHPHALDRATIDRWQAEGAVEYVGHSTDMPRLLSEATLVVLPSKYREGVPRVLVEAALVGRPLVATDVPGCREICVDGYTGRLVPKGDAGALADAILELLVDRALAERFGRNAREHAERHFTVERVRAETLDIYAAATRTVPS